MTATANANMSESIVAIIAATGEMSTKDIAEKVGKKMTAVTAMLGKLERDKTLVKREVTEGNWAWNIAPKSETPETPAAADETNAPAEFEGASDTLEWNGKVAATIHPSAKKSLDDKGRWGDKNGKKVHTIAGWWAAELNENGDPIGFLDLFNKNNPKKMKLSPKLRWTWKTEKSGIDNINIVREAIPNARLVRTNEKGEIIKVYDC